MEERIIKEAKLVRKVYQHTFHVQYEIYISRGCPIVISRAKRMPAHLFNSQIERRSEGTLDDVNVVDVGADIVHAVRGRGDHDGIPGGDAEDADEQVDGLVGADADEDLVGPDAAPIRPVALLKRDLIRAGVALEGEGVVVRVEGVGGEAGGAQGVLVGVEEDAGGVVVPGAPVRVEGQDVGTGQPCGHASIGAWCVCAVRLFLFVGRRHAGYRSVVACSVVDAAFGDQEGR